ncbi:hypothetical protein MTCT_0475 [Methanothermobacter sp. CaT2]|uniref:tetratricopeptide repeat protein n=1 Tax=Methanothermobacter sp. CaT2 TaxID=866790 RepID=UPI0002CD0CD2|nr:tetratricopeptide repeat protein [Methanothermobacter sp. CaT2]BAM69724.1 hypothetical protein MTCT_0475 [Methanothermobacter sp. CaT2]
MKRVLLALAEFLVGWGAPERALHIARRVTEADPENPAAWMLLSNINQKMERYRDALKALERLTEISPHPRAWHKMGYIHSILGEDEERDACYQRALELYESSINENPTNATLWYGRGLILHQWGEDEEALRSFEKATAIDPLHAQSWVYMGFSLNEHGRYREALGCFDRAIKLDAGNTLVWIGKAEAFGALGNQWASEKCLKMGLDTANGVPIEEDLPESIYPYPFRALTVISYAFTALTLAQFILIIFRAEFTGTLVMGALMAAAIYILLKERPRSELPVALGALVLTPFAFLYLSIQQLINPEESGDRILAMVSLPILFGPLILLTALILPYLAQESSRIMYTITMTWKTGDLYLLFDWTLEHIDGFLSSILFVLGPWYLRVNGGHPRALRHSTIMICVLLTYSFVLLLLPHII